MKTFTVQELKENPAAILKQAVSAPIRLEEKDAEKEEIRSFVLLDEAEYRGLLEAAHILQDERMRTSFSKSLQKEREEEWLEEEKLEWES